jgi:NADH-quinone oxidoreductase subunit C
VSEELLAKVGEVLGDRILDSHAAVGDATILVPREQIVEVMQMLRDHAELRFNFLMDLTAVDYLAREPRFDVVYHLASIEQQPRGSAPSRLSHRLRVKIGVPEEPCEAPSIVEVWPGANWMEREVWDLYGIRFQGHPDPRRILLYEQFEGHPLRKDYPKERRQPLVGSRN